MGAGAAHAVIIPRSLSHFGGSGPRRFPEPYLGMLCEWSEAVSPWKTKCKLPGSCGIRSCGHCARESAAGIPGKLNPSRFWKAVL